MDEQKLAFIKNDFLSFIDGLPETATANWGKMNAWQMVEHVIAFFKVSTERIKLELVTPEEHLLKYKEFLFSDKQFRENTKAPAAVIGEEPLPVRYSSYQEAKKNLHDAVTAFENYFKDNPGKKTLHPVFGLLNFDEWVLLHYKHVTHHLRQFANQNV